MLHLDYKKLEEFIAKLKSLDFLYQTLWDPRATPRGPVYDFELTGTEFNFRVYTYIIPRGEFCAYWLGSEFITSNNIAIRTRPSFEKVLNSVPLDLQVKLLYHMDLLDV